jgi:hypothetical protein
MNLYRCLLLFPILMAACSQPTSTQTIPAAAPPTPAAVISPSATPEDIYQVDVWVDNPTPQRGERVLVSGSLIKNGVHLNGPMMATWASERAYARGVPDCLVSISYQRSGCVLQAEDFPSGVYVPVKVVIYLNDEKYTGETGFTPK